jgi:FimV-like protein
MSDMIYLLIKSYLLVLSAIALGAMLLFTLGLWRIFKKASVSTSRHDLEDLSAIAGDDVLATQLDLARAYIETDKKAIAKKILDEVMRQGTLPQRKEAQHLLSLT